MATSNDTPAAPGKVRMPMVMLLVVVMTGTLLGLAVSGVGIYCLAKSGKLPLGQLMGLSAGIKYAPQRQIVMEPVLVNLADEGGHAYLRLGLTLQVADGSPAAAGQEESSAAKESTAEAKESSEIAPAKDAGKAASGGSQSSVRDTVLTVLGRQNSATLLGPDGKEHLKIELREAIQKSDPQLNLREIFLTEFLVQV